VLAPRAPACYPARRIATKIGRILVASDFCRSRHPGRWLIAKKCELLLRGLHHEMLAQGVGTDAIAWPEQEKIVIVRLNSYRLVPESRSWGDITIKYSGSD